MIIAATLLEKFPFFVFFLDFVGFLLHLRIMFCPIVMSALMGHICKSDMLYVHLQYYVFEACTSICAQQEQQTSAEDPDPLIITACRWHSVIIRTI